MATFRLDEVEGRYLNQLSATMRDAAMRGLHSAALRTVQHIQIEIIPSITPEPVGRGAYKAGWHVEPLPNGYVVVNNLLQAVFIEHGVRAENVKIGRKLIDALTEWVRMKGIGATVKTTKGGLKKVVKATQEEARGIAWAIAKNMKKVGIFNKGNGWNVLGRANKMAPQFIREEVAREMKKQFGS